MSDATGTWRGTSATDRVADRRERLVAACLGLLATEPDRPPTIRGVCRAANVGPRHLYELFPDMDALLAATHDAGMGELREVVDAVVERVGREPGGEVTVTDRLRPVFQAVVAVVEREPGIAAILFRVPMRDERLRAHATVSMATFVGTVRSLVVGRAAPREMADLEIAYLSGALASVFIAWTFGGVDTDRERLVDYCVSASVAVLGVAEEPDRR